MPFAVQPIKIAVYLIVAGCLIRIANLYDNVVVRRCVDECEDTGIWRRAVGITAEEKRHA